MADRPDEFPARAHSTRFFTADCPVCGKRVAWHRGYTPAMAHVKCDLTIGDLDALLEDLAALAPKEGS